MREEARIVLTELSWEDAGFLGFMLHPPVPAHLTIRILFSVDDIVVIFFVKVVVVHGSWHYNTNHHHPTPMVW